MRPIVLTRSSHCLIVLRMLENLSGYLVSSAMGSVLGFGEIGLLAAFRKSPIMELGGESGSEKFDQNTIRKAIREDRQREKRFAVSTEIITSSIGILGILHYINTQQFESAIFTAAYLIGKAYAWKKFFIEDKVSEPQPRRLD